MAGPIDTGAKAPTVGNPLKQETQETDSTSSKQGISGTTAVSALDLSSLKGTMAAAYVFGAISTAINKLTTDFFPELITANQNEQEENNAFANMLNGLDCPDAKPGARATIPATFMVNGKKVNTAAFMAKRGFNSYLTSGGVKINMPFGGSYEVPGSGSKTTLKITYSQLEQLNATGVTNSTSTFSTGLQSMMNIMGNLVSAMSTYSQTFSSISSALSAAPFAQKL